MLKSYVAPVAQWIEQRFPKPRAGRSIRLGGTNGNNTLRTIARFRRFLISQLCYGWK